MKTKTPHVFSKQRAPVGSGHKILGREIHGNHPGSVYCYNKLQAPHHTTLGDQVFLLAVSGQAVGLQNMFASKILRANPWSFVSYTSHFVSENNWHISVLTFKIFDVSICCFKNQFKAFKKWAFRSLPPLSCSFTAQWMDRSTPMPQGCFATKTNLVKPYLTESLWILVVWKWATTKNCLKRMVGYKLYIDL